MRTEVEVTQRDLDEGTPCSPSCCPVALAMRRVFDRDMYLSDRDFAFVGRHGELGSVTPLPRSVQAFIKGFDNPDTREEVTPFSFIVEVDG